MAKIYIGADHAGFELKKALVPFLEARGHEVVDCGAHELVPEDDYPDFVLPVAEGVAREPGALGIVVGGSGQGEAMAANRTSGVRAALFYGGPEEMVVLSREHNNANVLSLGARFISIDEATRAVEKWLAALFSGDERHIRRLAKF